MCLLCELGLNPLDPDQTQTDPLSEPAPMEAAGGVLALEPASAPGDGLIASLDQFYRWSWLDVDFAVATKASDYPVYYSSADEPSTFKAIGAGAAIFREAVDAWNGLSDLKMTEVAPAGGADIMIGGSTAPNAAWAYGPGFSSANGDVWVNVDRSFNGKFVSPPANTLGSYEALVAMHELGHSLGLKHPHEKTFLNSATLSLDFDGLEYTVMSYRSYVGDPTAGSYSVETWGYPQSPMMLDIAALQQIYGADHFTRADDTTYVFRPDTGAMEVDGEIVETPGANRIFRTIWDGDGYDTLDFSAYGRALHVDLRPGMGIDLDVDGFAQRARLGTENGQAVYAPNHIYMSLLHEDDGRSLIEAARGGSAGDVLIGNRADNLLDGGGGDDRITPGAGSNTVLGGAGTDTAIFAQTAAAITVTLDSGALVASYAGGSATLTEVEQLQSSDGMASAALVMAALAAAPGTAMTLETAAKGPPAPEPDPKPAPLGDIAGTVFLDDDGNGTRGADEGALSGWTVYLDADGDGQRDADEVSAVTGANGGYRFDGLATGQYTVALDLADGFDLTGGAATVTVSADATAGADFAVTPLPPAPPAEPEPPAAAQTEVFAQFGTLAAVDHTWQEVTLSHRFENPVVFATITSLHGVEIVAPRLDAIGPDGFKIMLQETADRDRIHTTESVSYVVMEAGVWDLADGRRIEAGLYDSDLLTSAGFDRIEFSDAFEDTPHVFSAVQTTRGLDYVTTRQTDAATTGVAIAMEEEEALNDGDHTTEILGWIAIEGGTTSSDGITLDSGRLMADHTGATWAQGEDAASGEYLLAQIASWAGSNPVTTRIGGPAATDLVLQEDLSRDTETGHVLETVDVLAFSGTGLMTATSIDDALIA